MDSDSSRGRLNGRRTVTFELLKLIVFFEHCQLGNLFLGCCHCFKCVVKDRATVLGSTVGTEKPFSDITQPAGSMLLLIVQTLLAALCVSALLIALVFRSRRQRNSIGFFHPYSDDGGGGERVLWYDDRSSTAIDRTRMAGVRLQRCTNLHRIPAWSFSLHLRGTEISTQRKLNKGPR